MLAMLENKVIIGLKTMYKHFYCEYTKSLVLVLLRIGNEYKTNYFSLKNLAGYYLHNNCPPFFFSVARDKTPFNIPQIEICLYY